MTRLLPHWAEFQPGNPVPPRSLTCAQHTYSCEGRGVRWTLRSRSEQVTQKSQVHITILLGWVLGSATTINQPPHLCMCTHACSCVHVCV